MNSGFLTAQPNLQKLDPLKRVNYTFGLVLGVEEFVQSDTCTSLPNTTSKTVCCTATARSAVLM